MRQTGGQIGSQQNGAAFLLGDRVPADGEAVAFFQKPPGGFRRGIEHLGRELGGQWRGIAGGSGDEKTGRADHA